MLPVRARGRGRGRGRGGFGESDDDAPFLRGRGRGRGRGGWDDDEYPRGRFRGGPPRGAMGIGRGRGRGRGRGYRGGRGRSESDDGIVMTFDDKRPAFTGWRLKLRRSTANVATYDHAANRCESVLPNLAALFHSAVMLEDASDISALRRLGTVAALRCERRLEEDSS
jgi:hypothetical protein